jgi:hypothetical protein
MKGLQLFASLLHRRVQMLKGKDSDRGLERWYLVICGVAVGRGFEPQSDLELVPFAKIFLVLVD